MEAGNLDEACPLLAESQRLDPGGGTLLNLAVCHERQGKLAEAWTEYHDAQSASVRDDRKDRQAFAAERIAALAGRLPHLVVYAPPSAPVGTVLTVDGAPLSSLAAGVPLPVDPGRHAVAVSAPGYSTWSTEISAAEGAGNVDVRVPALTRVVPIGPPPPVFQLRASTVAAGSVAVASYAAMAITGALALSKQSSAESTCVPARNFCSDPNAAREASEARTLAWASTVSLGVAIAATVITGVTLIWPRGKPVERPFALTAREVAVEF